MSKRTEKTEMSADIQARVADDLKRFVAVAGGPRGWSESMDLLFERASQALGIKKSRARAYWYREAEKISAVEYLAMRARAQELLERQANHARFEVEIAELRGQGRTADQRVGAAKDAGVDSEVARPRGGERAKEE